jgi:hypothetical protein
MCILLGFGLIFPHYLLQENLFFLGFLLQSEVFRLKLAYRLLKKV